LAYDKLQILNKNTHVFDDIAGAGNSANNQFNSTYRNLGTNIVPGQSDYHGMDLDIYDTSASMKHKQESTKIRFGVSYHSDGTGDGTHGFADQVFPQVLGFSTELYIPRVCYDYGITLGDYITVPSPGDRSFTTVKTGTLPLKINFMLKSLEADFDLMEAVNWVNKISRTKSPHLMRQFKHWIGAEAAGDVPATKEGKYVWQQIQQVLLDEVLDRMTSGGRTELKGRIGKYTPANTKNFIKKNMKIQQKQLDYWVNVFLDIGIFFIGANKELITNCDEPKAHNLLSANNGMIDKSLIE